MDAATAQIIVAVLAIVGSPVFLGVVGRGIYRWVTGKSGRDRARDTNIETQRQRAVEERDNADRGRRKALEYASYLRGRMSEHGLEPGAWWPDLDRTLTRAEVREQKKTK